MRREAEGEAAGDWDVSGVVGVERAAEDTERGNQMVCEEQPYTHVCMYVSISKCAKETQQKHGRVDAGGDERFERWLARKKEC